MSVAPNRRPWLLWIAVLAAALVAAPLVSVGTHVFSGGTGETWRHLASTVLGDYVASTLWLCAGVGLGVAALGVGSAWLVTRYDFAGRAQFEWALVLPLAMPSYVIAYVYTDFLQYIGPVQTALRAAFGWRKADYWFPDVRTLGGAALMFALVLYPYVYMLARTAFIERAGGMIEVGRSLGLSPFRAFLRLSLPMARPAIAGGVALALMETLADYGTVSYFAVQTFTTGIYRAWFSLGDRVAAAQLALVLLAFVVAVLTVERVSRGGRRYHDTTLRRLGSPRAPLSGVKAVGAVIGCVLPLVAGFLLPAGLLLRMALTDGDAQFGERFFVLARNSMLVAGTTAVLAVALALLIGYAARVHRGRVTRWAHRVVGLGYALPGSVIAVGVLIPVTRLDHALAALIGEPDRAHARPAVHRQHCRAGLRLPRALPDGGGAGDRRGPGPHHAEHGPRGAQPRPECGADTAARASADAAGECADGGAAGVHRRDEGAARDTGDAPLQLRHAGHADLHAGLGRAADRGLDRGAGDRGGGAGADGAAVPQHRQGARHGRLPLTERLSASQRGRTPSVH